jgi:hypothetical protein
MINTLAAGGALLAQPVGAPRGIEASVAGTGGVKARAMSGWSGQAVTLHETVMDAGTL